jgi:hypothetical protein
MNETIKTYVLPTADMLGNWIKLDRLEFRDSKKIAWRVTWENAVGGEVAERFKTRESARSYIELLCAVKPLLSIFPGRDILVSE